jgi:hypothetical protein
VVIKVAVTRSDGIFGTRTVGVVVPLVFAECVQQVCLVPHQRAVEQFAAAALDPAFHDRVHSGHLDPAEHNLDACLGEDRVEQGRVLAVPVADEVPHVRPGVPQVHDQVPGGLGHPGGGRVRGPAKDADAAAGVLDDRENVHPRGPQA